MGEDEAHALAVSGSSVYMAGYFGSVTASSGTVAFPNPISPVNISFLATITDRILTATTAAACPVN